MTIFWLLDNLYRNTAPVSFPDFIYRDYFPAIYQTCTASAPACNKNCSMKAKSTPFLACHRDNYLPKVPGPVAGWLRQITCHRCSLAPRYPDITCRDLMLGPLYCWAVSSNVITNAYKSICKPLKTLI
jgi:hypothetical protein